MKTLYAVAQRLSWLWVVWLGILSVPAVAQQGPLGQPRLWSPNTTDPDYQARKQRLARQQQASQPMQRVSPVPGRNLLPQARPACFEPFDTTATGGWSQLGRNDDNSFGPVNLGWNFSLFGTTYNQVYINNNGNITFDSPLNSFNAQGLPINIPMIAAFWADVDTRNPGSGTVWYRVFADRLVVVWNRVGYFDSRADKKNTFQLVIKANTAPGFSGNDVLISYDDMQWTTGDFSNGVNGFGGIPATVGANRGNNVDFIQTGRFNLSNSQAPNIPNGGDPGGVSWLDGQCLGYQVGAVTSANIPPAVAGLPSGNTITVDQGQTRAVPLQFSGPETNQTVTVSTNLNGLCNAAAPVSGNGGTNPNVAFSVTGSPCNVGTQTVTFTATDNGLPLPAQSVFTLTVVVNPPVAGGQWTGAVSTTYTDPANWSNNVVPGATDDVTIPAGVPRMPVLNATVSANSFAVASGASMTVGSGGVLRLNGNLTTNGSLSGAGTLQTTGAAVQSVGGSSGVSIANLSVGTAGLQLSTPLSVAQLLTLSGNLASNGNLTLRSDATGTAMVVNNGAAAVTGSTTVQRYLDPSLNSGPGYRHLAAPVINTTLADLATAGFAPQVNPAYNTAPAPGTVSPFPNVFFYDQALVAATGSGAVADFDRGWVSPGSTTEAMVPGRGYTVNLSGGQTLDFVGTLGNGTVPLAGLARSTQDQSGWQLLGNPYPAPIDWNQARTAATGLDNAVYVFKSSGQYTGTYASYINGVGTNGGSSTIAMGQGFFVRVSAPGTTGSLTLSNSARLTTYSNVPLQRTAETRPLLLLSLHASSGPPDQTAIYFEAGAGVAADAAFDARRLHNASPIQLASLAGSEELAINGLPALAARSISVPLLVRVAQGGTYTLQADELLNLPPGWTATLHDAVTGTRLNLQQQPAYTCTLDPTQAPTRFSVEFSPGRALSAASTRLSEQVALYPNPARSQAWLSLPTLKQPAEVLLLNALGQTVQRQVLPAGRATVTAIPLGSLAQGVYTLRMRLPEGIVTKRLVVE